MTARSAADKAEQQQEVEQRPRPTMAKMVPARSLKTVSMTDFLWRLSAGGGEAARRAAEERYTAALLEKTAAAEAQLEQTRKVQAP